jgi:hypothetical protein
MPKTPLPDAHASPAGRERAAGCHGRIWGWAAFDPPLRDPRSPLRATRQVWCRVCGTQLGEGDDPVDAILVAWRHRRHMG